MATELHLGDRGPAVKRLRLEGDRQRAGATLVSLAVTLALAVAALVAVTGAEAAGNAKCGDVITTDTTLHKDLVDCPNNGIVIGADDVTLDLNGHLIDGDGTVFAGCPQDEVCDIGVLNDGHDGVTVMHGRVREFGVGVLFGTSTAGRVRHNRVLGVSSSRNLLFGFVLDSSARSLVRNSSGSNNIPPEGDGMGLFASHHIRILHNSFRHNAGPGIHVEESTRNLIKGNLLSRDGPAILLQADRNEVRGNRIIRGAGIFLAPGNRNVIARNRISHTSRAGGVGIEVDGGDHNVIARNSVRDTAGDAISVGFLAVVGNVVRRNHIRRAGKDGVDVDDKARNTLLKRNHVFGANDDGLDANNPTTRLTRNEARRNGDLGIEAVLGVIDGGGNAASGNGDPFQCKNILCS